MIVLRRIDVNKKPFSLFEIPDLVKSDPARVNCVEQIQRAPVARFDQLCRPSPARFDAVQGGERLWPLVC